MCWPCLDTLSEYMSTAIKLSLHEPTPQISLYWLTNPASAIIFSSSSSSFSSPSVPSVQVVGFCSVGVVKVVLPSPPLPPRAATQLSWGEERSANNNESAVTTVPTGTYNNTRKGFHFSILTCTQTCTTLYMLLSILIIWSLFMSLSIG